MELRFVRPIPGFPNHNIFSLIESKETAPFYKLCPIEGEFSFLLLHTFDFMKDYEFTLPDVEKHLLKLDEDSKVLVFSIVNWRGGLKEATINLKAPIVVNISEKIALQVILDSDQYKVNQSLFQALEQK